MSRPSLKCLLFLMRWMKSKGRSRAEARRGMECVVGSMKASTGMRARNMTIPHAPWEGYGGLWVTVKYAFLLV